MDETVSSVGTLASLEKKLSKIHEFKVLGNLGEGSFSTVYKVQRYADGKIYAMKKVRMSRLTEREKSNALNEIRILASTKSDHVVEYKDSFFDGSSDSLCIVMEYAENGDLLQKLNAIKFQNKRNQEDSLLKTPSDKGFIPNVEEEASVVSIGQVESNAKATQNYDNDKQNNDTVLSEQLDSTQKHTSPKKQQPKIILDSQTNQNSQTASNTDPLRESYQINRSAASQQQDDNRNRIDPDHHKQNWIFMPEEEVWDYLIQCAKGLECLHQMGIVHRDLKCANVLISQHNIVKIGDLNVSVVTRKASHLGKTHPGGTPFYTAPEVWSGHACDFKSDIWSLGCVAYELCAQKPPFEGTTLAGLCTNILKGSFRRIPKVYSDELSAVIELCLTFKANERPSSQELLMIPEIQVYLKAYQDRYSQYLKCATVQKLHGEIEHLSPQRRAKRNLLEQQHLIDTINLPSNLKKLSPLLPRAHYEDIFHQPAVAEFQFAKQDGHGHIESNEIGILQQDKGYPKSNLMADKYHELVKQSPIRFTLQKVKMDESRLIEDKVSDSNSTLEDGIQKNSDVSGHEIPATDRSQQSIQRNNIDQQHGQEGQECMDGSKKKESYLQLSEDISIDKDKFKDEQIHKMTENASRLKMLSEYLEKLRAKPSRIQPHQQQQLSSGCQQFGAMSICRDFENVSEVKQSRQKHTKTLSRDSSSEQQGGNIAENKNKDNNNNNNNNNHVKFSVLEKTTIKNNHKAALLSGSMLNQQTSAVGNDASKYPQASNVSQISQQQMQIMSNLANYQLQNFLPRTNNQVYLHNLPTNSSNLQDISQVKQYYAQINSSCISNSYSNGIPKNTGNLQKTLTTNDSVGNLSPPIRRTRRILSHQTNNTSNNSNYNNNIMNQKEDQETVGVNKPKSTSPQPRFTQFSQVLRRYLPKQSIYQNRIASLDKQPALSVVAAQVSRSPPVVIQKRVVLSAKITSSKGAAQRMQQPQQQQPCQSFHVAQKQNQQSDQGQTTKFTARDENNNQENIFASSNYPNVSLHRGHSSRIQRQFKEPSCQHTSLAKDGLRVVKLAHICNKHSNNTFEKIENAENSIFYDNTKVVPGDRSAHQWQQMHKNPHHLEFHTDRNNYNKERLAYLQSVRNQLAPFCHNKNSVSQPNPHQFLPVEHNQNERKHNFVPVFLR